MPKERNRGLLFFHIKNSFSRYIFLLDKSVFLFMLNFELEC
ncbi:hypothetical protein Cs308_0488 [Candidatus Chlamydia sanziniae]|uniref:Uncharacterized protein n=1 Tax=Candidatus Chlamydia sanziniae TaxID=1806891 RepID=A0A1A9HUJ4_9CHLA|nr:hypothetical protein Cs308_0488 [Candidatus Chlamydia sanziniae]